MLHKIEIARKPRQGGTAAPAAIAEPAAGAQADDGQRAPPSLRKWAHKDFGANNQSPIDKLRAESDSGRRPIDHLRTTFKGF